MTKKIYCLGYSFLIALMLSSTILVSAGNIDIPSLDVTGKGVKWQFSLIDPNSGEPYFSFADVNQDTIQGVVYLSATEIATITPVRITFSEKTQTVTLHFSPKDLPKSALQTFVTGSLNDEITTFSAAGPGWMWRSGGG
jgi:hypothetical protein